MINIYPQKLIKIKEWFLDSDIKGLYKSELSKNKNSEYRYL